MLAWPWLDRGALWEGSVRRVLLWFPQYPGSLEGMTRRRSMMAEADVASVFQQILEEQAGQDNQFNTEVRYRVLRRKSLDRSSRSGEDHMTCSQPHGMYKLKYMSQHDMLALKYTPPHGVYMLKYTPTHGIYMLKNLNMHRRSETHTYQTNIYCTYS